MSKKCNLDSTQPDFGALCELVEGLDPYCQITKVDPRKNGKKRKGWSPSARRNASFATYAAVASGRRKASKEKVAAARRMLMEAGQAHRINGAAA